MTPLMLCVAKVLMVLPLAMPTVERVDLAGKLGWYLWETETIQLDHTARNHMLAHEVAHYLQHKHGKVTWSSAGIPVFDHDLEDQALFVEGCGYKAR